MFKCFKKLTSKFKFDQLCDMASQFNSAYGDKFSLTYDAIDYTHKIIKVQPRTYYTSHLFFHEGIEPLHGGQEFDIFKEQEIFWAGEWFISTHQSIWNSGMQTVKLSDYLQTTLPKLLIEWLSIVANIPKKYSDADIHVVNGAIGYMMVEQTIKSAFLTCEADLETDTEFKEYFHQVIDYHIAAKKADNDNPDDVHLDESDKISYWIPESYHNLSEFIDNDLDTKLEYQLSRVKARKQDAINAKNDEARFYNFMTESERHYRKLK